MLAPSSFMKLRRDSSSDCSVSRYAFRDSRRSFIARSPVARGARDERPPANLWRGCAVTLDAPGHGHRRGLFHGIHHVHLPVTSLAADAIARMHGVIEVHKIR